MINCTVSDKLYDERIAGVIYKKITGNLFEAADQKVLKKWMRSSYYYRTLVEDIENDQQLKNKLLQAYIEDKDEFWKIIITYRAALHNGMPPRRGNFWQRLFRE